MTGDGWTKGSDGIWAKNGKRAAFTIVTTAGDKRRELTEQIIQPQLKTAGFDMKIKNTRLDDLFGQLLPTGTTSSRCSVRVSLALLPACARCSARENIPGPANDNSGNNTSFASIPELDKQLRIVDTNLDDNARKAAAKKADDILADYNVALPLDPMPDILIWSEKVVGPVSDNPIEGMFWNIDQWGIKQ